MDLHPQTENYIKESIENMLGLTISEKNTRLKLLALEDSRHVLKEQIFLLEDGLRDTERRLEHYKAEASMNAQGLRRCIEEKEEIAIRYNELAEYCTKLEDECTMNALGFNRATEACDELERENNCLRAQLKDDSIVLALRAQVEALQKDKENLLINLNRAEDEVKLLSEENRILDEENKKLLGILRRGKQQTGSDGKHSASASAKGSQKSSMKKKNFEGEDSRPPLSPLHFNSPDLSSKR